jgi:hypothetical protein
VGIHGKGKAAIKALGAKSYEMFARYADGQVTERVRTSISNDGKTLTRRITLTSPQGRQSWTEIYDRQ